jgi:hypothetical protein
MTKESKHEAVIGSSIELEMNKRHRTATLGYCKAAKEPGCRWRVDTHCRWLLIRISSGADLVTGIDEASAWWYARQYREYGICNPGLTIIGHACVKSAHRANGRGGCGNGCGFGVSREKIGALARTVQHWTLRID